jgi:hypothetical protein
MGLSTTRFHGIETLAYFVKKSPMQKLQSILLCILLFCGTVAFSQGALMGGSLGVISYYDEYDTRFVGNAFIGKYKDPRFVGLIGVTFITGNYWELDEKGRAVSKDGSEPDIWVPATGSDPGFDIYAQCRAYLVNDFEEEQAIDAYFTGGIGFTYLPAKFKYDFYNQFTHKLVDAPTGMKVMAGTIDIGGGVDYGGRRGRPFFELKLSLPWYNYQNDPDYKVAMGLTAKLGYCIRLGSGSSDESE